VDDSRPEQVNDSGRKPLGWLQLLGEVGYTLKSSMGSRLPDEFWQHAHTARREGMLAVRSLLDRQISRLEQQEQRSQQAREKRATKIDVH
jgi:hypothetical protein